MFASLKCLAIKEVLNNIGNEDLKKIQKLIPILVGRNLKQAEDNFQKIIQDILPGYYNDPRKDWVAEYHDGTDTIKINWKQSTTRLSISDHAIEFQYHYEGVGYEPYCHVGIVPNKNPNITRIDEFYEMAEGRRYKFLQKSVCTFEDWINFVIHAYTPLVLRFQDIKKQYYNGLNNISDI